MDLSPLGTIDLDNAFFSSLFSIVICIGAALPGKVGGRMIITDPVISR